MKRAGIVILLLVIAGSLAAATHSRPDAATSTNDGTLPELQARVDELIDRVARLEHAAGGGRVTVAEGGARVRTMRVDSIVQSDHYEDHSEDMEQLRREISSLEQTITAQQSRISRLEGRRGASGRSRRGQRPANQRLESEISSERRVLSRYQADLRRRQTGLRRLERSAGQPKQIIHGTDGEITISLHSEVDLSDALQNVSSDDRITWTGRRGKLDASSELWIVDSIAKVESGTTDE